MRLLSDDQIESLSVVADGVEDERVFALCARAWRGDRAARVALTEAYERARRAARAAR